MHYVTGGAVSGLQSAALLNQLRFENAQYSYSTNNLWAATISHVVINNNSTADRLSNFRVYTEVFNNSTITDFRALYIEAPVFSGGTNIITSGWDIYQESSSQKNYFNGSILIGDTTDTGHKFQVNGTIRNSSYTDRLAIAAPATPAAGYGRYYVSSVDGKAHFISAAGVDYDLTATAAGGSGLVVTNEVDNRIITSTGAGTGNAEANLTYDGSLISVIVNSIGTAPVDTTGLVLINTTAAADGAQQASPAVRWSAQGWKTNATAASQEVEFRSYVLPIQGTSSPAGEWKLQTSINSGAYADKLVIRSNNSISLNTGVASNTNAIAAYGSTASASGAIALSKDATASGVNSLVIGGQNGIASGMGAVNIGTDGEAAGNYSLSANDANNSYGISSSCFGFGNLNWSENGFAAGQNNIAGHTSGSGGTPDAFDVNIVMGVGSKTAAHYAMAFGNTVYVNAMNAIAIGHGIGGTFMTHSTADSLGIGFNSTVPTVIVNPATGAGTAGIVDLKGHVRINGITTIENDNALSNLLVIAADGQIKTRTAASLGGGAFSPTLVVPDTTTYTVTQTSGFVVIHVNAGGLGGNVTLNFPTAVGNTAIYVIKKCDDSAFTVTIDPSGAELVDGSSTATLTRPRQSITVYSDGTSLNIV
jgi:hypothetical protein